MRAQSPMSKRNPGRVWLERSRAFLLAAATGLAAEHAIAEPTRIIVDTDIMGDVDDVGALAVLHALADNQEAKIVGIVVDTANPAGAVCVDVLNTYYGRLDIPIGTLKPHDASAPTPYQQALVSGFPHALKDGSDAPDAVTTYRRLLAAEASGSA